MDAPLHCRPRWVSRAPLYPLRLALGLLFALPPQSAGGADDDVPPARTSTAPQLAPQPPPSRPLNLFSLLPAHALTRALEDRHATAASFAERVERVTRGLLGAPYLLSPLGEGHPPDPDPRFRLDAFDCTTFVETALALAHCDSPEGAAALLDEIRYIDGLPLFARRRHLATSQWIPGLVAAGYLRDVTRAIGGEVTGEVVLELTPERWSKRKVARTLVLSREEVPDGTFRLPYIPIGDFAALADRFPEVALINVVRDDVRGAPDVITHQALLLRRPGDGAWIVRHASPVSRRVLDEPLAKILTRYAKPRRWTIMGLNVLEVLPPAHLAGPSPQP